VRNLETAYLRFLKFAQAEDGQFYCYVTFDLQKLKPGTGDWFGRAVFSLAFLTSRSQKFGPVCFRILAKSLPLYESRTFSLRTTSFLVLSLYYLFEHNKKTADFKKQEVENLKKILKKWRDNLKKQAEANCTTEWFWPEEKITYDNGKVIQAYLIIGYLLDDITMLTLGQKMLDFYIKQTFKRGYFQAPGNNGFWEKGGTRPKNDEQALEAYSLIAACVSAYKLVGNKMYYSHAKEVYKWFWGKNRLKKALVEYQSGAVYDALEKDTINNNQGAESTLSLHLAYFALTKNLHL
jgi:uncharacterized protein YyaL (SSP411 family)